MGSITGILMVISIISLSLGLTSLIAINSLNYLFPILKISIDFWSILSMIVLMCIFNQPRFIGKYGKTKDV